MVCFTALLYAGPALGQDSTAAPVRCGQQIDFDVSVISDTQRSLWRALSITSLPRNGSGYAAASGLFRSASVPTVACIDSLLFLSSWQTAPGEHMRVLPVETAVRSNSAYPRSVNDGAAWLGLGWNLGATAGVRAQWKFLTAQAAPQIYYQQNADFVFPGNAQPGFSEFANPYHLDIDMPNRFGRNAYSTFDAGQSFLLAQAGAIGFTAGTENMWIGAADVYPILMSYTAPGFPHFRIGTQRPLNLRVVDVEFQLVFASLSESKYFDGPGNNDDHYFTTTMAVLRPHFLPGLSIGVARAYHDSTSATGHNVGFYLDHLIETPFGAFSGGNRVGNGIGVLMAQWVLPESRFEAYAEWGREDTPGDWKDVLREPDWTQAYVLGFSKAFTQQNHLVRVYGELIHLGESAPSRAGRGFFSYYTHGLVTQGHTNQGQLLGAAIGPGSDAQLLGVDVFSSTGRSALRIERTRYDDDTYYHTFARRFGETRHDAEITLSAGRTQLVRSFELDGGVALSKRYGRSFIPLPNDEPDLIEYNWAFRFGLAWRPPRRAIKASD